MDPGAPAVFQSADHNMTAGDQYRTDLPSCLEHRYRSLTANLCGNQTGHAFYSEHLIPPISAGPGPAPASFRQSLAPPLTAKPGSAPSPSSHSQTWIRP